jgi:N-acetylneuraminic acid mutarotase
MSNRRANFCHIVLDNMVYVFGGISGQSSEKNQEHVPKMPTINAEKYNPITNTWENIEIPNIPSLGAFAWTPKGKNSSEIIILGGTDGDVIQESMWTIDFKTKTAKMSEFEFEQTFAMNKLLYRPE